MSAPGLVGVLVGAPASPPPPAPLTQVMDYSFYGSVAVICILISTAAVYGLYRLFIAVF